MDYNKKSEILAITRNKPNIEFYKVKKCRLIFLQEIKVNRNEMINKIRWIDDENIITCGLNG